MARRRPDHRPDVSHEPHLSGGPIVPEECNRLEDEPSRASEVPPECADSDSAVSDEPSLTWRNLNRAIHPGYAEHLHEHVKRSRPGLQWLAVVIAALIAGPFAIFAAFYKAYLGQGGWGLMAVIVIGPVIEEMGKIACAYWLVERRPWLLPGVGGIIVIGLISGFTFAAIENWVYLNIYFPDHEPWLAQWRWTVNVALHTGCTVIAAIGVARMWKRVMESGKAADLAVAFPWLAAAMILHGAYNGLAVVFELLGGQS